VILFKESMVPLILNGTKTVTRRRGKCRWRVGAIHLIYTRPPFSRNPGKPVARVRIVSVTFETSPGSSIAPLKGRDGLVRAKDIEAGREGFHSWGMFLGTYALINGGSALREDSYRVEFELVDTKGAV